MKKAKPKRRVASRRRPALFAWAIVAILAATAISVISRQGSTQKVAATAGATNISETANKVTATAARTYITRRIGGQDIQIDSQTGEIKPLTPAEARRLANGLAPMLDRSTDGLVQVRHADGSVSMDLQGRFQDVAVARVNTDGTVSLSCVNDARSAGKFFGIDPKNIENAPTARKRLNPN